MGKHVAGGGRKTTSARFSGTPKGGPGPQEAGSYTVFYPRDDANRDDRWMGFGAIPFTSATLSRSHVEVTRMMAGSGEDVFKALNDFPSQAGYRRWGEQTRAKGASHASMSTGDVLRAPNGDFYVVADNGWVKID